MRQERSADLYKGDMSIPARLLLIVLLLAGCQPTLMPTPVIYGDDGVDPLAEVDAVAATTEVPVFIAIHGSSRKMGVLRRGQPLD